MAEFLIASLSPTGTHQPDAQHRPDLVARGDRVTVMTGADTRRNGPRHRRGTASAARSRRLRRGAVRRRRSAAAPRHQGAQSRDHPAVSVADAASGRGVDGRDGAHPVRRDHRRLRVLRSHPAAARRSSGPTARPVLHPTPLMLSSRDTAPNGMGLAPGTGAIARLRNRALNQLSQRVILREAQRNANAMLEDIGAPRLPVFLLDVGVLADRLIVPTVPGFEYPRSDLAPNVRFVGAVHPRPARGYDASAVVARTGRRPAGRPRHPGNRRQRRPVPARSSRPSTRSAARTYRGGHHRRTRRRRHQGRRCRRIPLLPNTSRTTFCCRRST